MDTAWRILDCSSLTGSIRSARGAIEIRPEEGAFQSVPVADVAVVLLGTRVSISTAVMHRLLDADVVVMFCDWRGVPEGAAYPWRAHTRVGARQRAQAELSLPRQKNAWGRLVRAKVLGQAHVLSTVDKSTALRLRNLAKSVHSGDPENVEGQAARLYWARLFGPDQSFLRLPESEDPWNTYLNYGYGVLRAHGVRAVVGAGLNPTLGLFHRGRSNYFNLVDDLIEPFRPAVDATVLTLPAEGSLADRSVKQRLVQAVLQPFNAGGDTLPTVLERLAQHLGQYVEGDRKRLDVPQWTGPHRDRDNGR
ncbi:type II CRISPR-associated endonuclease Cas1 [Actinomyces lilanjuaniae]|uniref:CRISPR-associated endonuclease Cas1 n=1 Tax=Actinomyces lilanjuaniae TaxID=2321394 RepID=A0ABN5PN40_9ACTO|nr:type II CRISPR-associated endonuclease Cas1 [Actinomyces lilanjuaniae]AYD89103.1 type II CRISPR-associated endonuclease Cas1 [Actinomyces lilanjuaniae]